MAVLKTSTTLLLLFVCGVIAPPPITTDPPTDKPWYIKKMPATQLSPVTTSTDHTELLKLISAAQKNAGPPQAPPSQPVTSTINGKVTQAADTTNRQINQAATLATTKVDQAATLATTKVDQAAQLGITANTKLTQAAATAMKGKDALMDTINPKKTKEELVLELKSLVPQLEGTYLAAKFLLANADEKSRDELDAQLTSIKDTVKPAIVGQSQIMAQVNKAKDNIQQAISNPSDMKDKAVQAVTNSPITQSVVNHPITQGVVNHPITQGVKDKVASITSPWLEKWNKRGSPPTVM